MPDAALTDPADLAAGRPASPVARRTVFYIPGHDPAGGRRYREIYRVQGQRQAAISGYGLAVRALAKDGDAYRWAATGTINGHRTEAVIEVLDWSDIVKDTLAHGLPHLYAQILAMIPVFLGSGLLPAVRRIRPPMLVALLYPYLAYLLVPVLAGAAGALLWGAAAWGMGLSGWPALPVAALFAAAALLRLRRWDGRYFLSYLLLSYAYHMAAGGRLPPALAAREERFAERVAGALADPEVDEVLIVGHSVGARLGVTLAARLVREGQVPPGKLALLGLGSVTQLISFLPRAGWLRRDLNLLAQAPEIAWVEVAAPADGMSFALCDPAANSGADPAPERKRWPRIVSAAFSRTLSPETRRSPEFTPFRKHFQYLYAFDRPGPYDYFAITAGPRRLGERFPSRPAEGNRVTAAVSRHRDLAP